MKKMNFYLFTVISCVFLTGCWDKMELEDRAYVVALGIDKSDKGNLFDVTFQIANPQTGSSARGDMLEEPPSDIVTITASDVLLAKDVANSIVTRRISFRHLDTLIIGEELARSDRALHILNSIIVEPEIRHGMSFIVSKEPAQQFIQANKPAMETRPHKYYEFMRERWKDVGFVPNAKLKDYFQRLSGGLFLASYATAERENNEPRENEREYTSGEVPQKSGDPVQMIGSAVFKDGKMIDTLTGLETRIALSLRDKILLRNPISTFKDPLNEDFPISVQVLKAKKLKVKFDIKKDPVQINVTVPLQLYVFSDLSLIDYATDMKNQKILKQSLKKQFEEVTRQFIKKTQEELKGEPFMWSLYVRRQFSTVQEYNKFNWEEKYQNANINVAYEIELVSFGEQARPAKTSQEM